MSYLSRLALETAASAGVSWAAETSEIQAAETEYTLPERIYFAGYLFPGGEVVSTRFPILGRIRISSFLEAFPFMGPPALNSIPFIFTRKRGPLPRPLTPIGDHAALSILECAGRGGGAEENGEDSVKDEKFFEFRPNSKISSAPLHRSASRWGGRNSYG